MKERPALRKKIDALYAGPPDEFVAARNALAKELKKDGKTDEAKHVSGLKRPTVAASVLNRVANEREAEIKAFAKAAAALRRASGKKLREAARAEREAAEALVDAADELMTDGGASAATRDRIIETIQAAAADPDLEELLVAGRLEKERSVASVGFAIGLDGGGREDEDEGDGDGDEEAHDEEKESAAERNRRERELKAAEKRVHAAKGALKKANEAKKRTAKALDEAEKKLEKARDADREAAAKIVEAEHELQDQEEALNEL